MKWAGHVARMYNWVSVGKPEGKRLLGRPRRSWEDSIEMLSSGSGMWGHGLDRSG